MENPISENHQIRHCGTDITVEKWKKSKKIKEKKSVSVSFQSEDIQYNHDVTSGP